jgi:hypothetical protein
MHYTAFEKEWLKFKDNAKPGKAAWKKVHGCASIRIPDFYFLFYEANSA